MQKRQCETVATTGYRGDGRRTERLAQRRDLHREVVLFDDQARPDGSQQFVPCRPRGRCVRSARAKVEGAPAQCARFAVDPQLAFVRADFDRSEPEHPAHCAPLPVGSIVGRSGAALATFHVGLRTACLLPRTVPYPPRPRHSKRKGYLSHEPRCHPHRPGHRPDRTAVLPGHRQRQHRPTGRRRPQRRGRPPRTHDRADRGGQRLDDRLAEAKAEKLVQEDRVDVIFGGIYSSTRQAIKAAAVVRGRTLYIYPASSTKARKRSLIFCTGPVPAQQVDSLIRG